MMRSLLLCTVALGADVLPGRAHAADPPPVVADVRFERAFGGIPFTFARVDGSPPLHFMIDTGGAGSIIDHDVARKLGLESVPARASVSGNEALAVRVVPRATIRVGGASISTRLSVHRLSALAPTFGRRIDGILGGDFFRPHVVEINYDQNRIRVYRRHRWSGNGHSLPLEVSNGVPFVNFEVRLDGGRRVTGPFLIDSAGGWMTIHVHRQVAERAGIAPSPTAVSETGLGLGGASRRDVVRGESFALGKYSLSGPPVAITDDMAGLRTNPSSSGLVGVEVLRKFNVVFDYDAQRLYLTPSRAFSQPFVYDATGLRLEAAAPDFRPAVVARVLPASPAFEAGFQAGDTILSVDRRSVAAWTLEQLRDLFRQPGKVLAVRVRRDGRIVDLTLHTRELL